MTCWGGAWKRTPGPRPAVDTPSSSLLPSFVLHSSRDSEVTTQQPSARGGTRQKGLTRLKGVEEGSDRTGGESRKG